MFIILAGKNRGSERCSIKLRWTWVFILLTEKPFPEPHFKRTVSDWRSKLCHQNPLKFLISPTLRVRSSLSDCKPMWLNSSKLICKFISNRVVQLELILPEDFLHLSLLLWFLHVEKSEEISDLANDDKRFSVAYILFSDTVILGMKVWLH